MRKQKRFLTGIFAATGILLIACGQIARAAAKLPVFVSIPPQKYFVQQIGKAHVDVQVMVQPGASPAVYEPSPRQMAALSEARIYFAVGVPFEKTWLKKIAAVNPDMQVVHTDQGIKKIPMAAHRPGAEDSTDTHAHGELDPHIWLSPPLVIIQVQTILQALVNSDAAHIADYEANAKAFMGAIRDLDADLRNIFAGKQGRQFMVFHPAWGYFAHAYGIQQVPVEIEGKVPKPAQLEALIAHARKNHIKMIFAQPQFSAKSARLIAKAINGRVVIADPLAGDWLQNLRSVAVQFEAALK